MSYPKTRRVWLLYLLFVCFGPAISFSATAQDLDGNSSLSRSLPQDAAAWVSLGKELWLKGEPQKAIEAYRKAIDLNPKYEPAYLELSAIQASSGNREELIETLYSAHRILPKSDDLSQRLVAALITSQRYSEALQVGKEYLVSNPRNAEVLFNMGYCYLNLKDFENAITMHQKAVEVDPDQSKAWQGLSYVLTIVGRYEEALTALQYILDRDPQFQFRNEVWSSKVSLLTRLGRTQMGMDEVERELQANPNNAYALLIRGTLKQSQNKPEEAIADLKQGLASTGNDRLRYKLYTVLGWSQTTLGHYPEAVEALLKAIELFPDDPLCHALLATAYYYSSENEKAMDSLEMALQSKSGISGLLFDTPQFSSVVFNALAGCLVKLERWPDAEKALRYSVQLDPTLIGPRMNLSFVLLQQNKQKDAESELRAAIRLNIADWRTYAALGGVLIQGKNNEEAAKIMRQALKLKPEDPGIMNNLGYTLLELDTNLEEALSLIMRAVKAAPLNWNFRDSLGWAYFKTGKLAEAEKELLQVCKANPKSLAALEHLGDVYQKLQKKEDARSYWRAALNITTEEDAKIRLQQKIDAR